MQTDYLVIGQGLAGTILALQLLEKNFRVIVADTVSNFSASLPAAGIVNPIVFKEVVKSWRADQFLPYMENFYSKLETRFGHSFYQKKLIYKIISNENEKLLWQRKFSDPELALYLEPWITPYPEPEKVHGGCGIATVKGCGWLNTALFLKVCRDFFRSAGLLREEVFSNYDLELKEGRVKWHGITAKGIIFCEGAKAVANPFFSDLPFKITKGEVLTIRSENLRAENILYRGVFLLPLGNGLYKAGATYSWDDREETLTEKGKLELTEKIAKVLKLPFEVAGQQAGFRPNTSDRRPFIGRHREREKIYIFNGFGSKGVLMMPYLAACLADALEEGGPLKVPEADIIRFY